jgi:hypothetical protein
MFVSILMRFYMTKCNKKRSNSRTLHSSGQVNNCMRTWVDCSAVAQACQRIKDRRCTLHHAGYDPVGFLHAAFIILAASFVTMAFMLDAEHTIRPRSEAQLPTWWRVLLVCEHPLWSALLAMAVYTAIAAHYGPLWHASSYAYFNYLADAFNHGQLSLRQLPPTTHDLSVLDGRYYLYWPPFPAVLLQPFVAIFGIQFSDILFTIGIAGLNVVLVALLLRRACARDVIELNAMQRAILVLFVALGTVHLTLAPYGRVWFTAQLIGFGAIALAYLAALSLRGTAAFVCAGLAMAAALTTRNHLALAGLWPAWYLLAQHRQLGRRRVLVYVLAGLTPVILAIGLLGVYNAARFGSFTDTGLAYHQMAAFFAAGYQQYGVFSLHYVPTNFYYQFIAYPFPVDDWSFLGGSLFLLSPVFFGALWGVVVGTPRLSTALLSITVVLVAIPIMLLMGTGWVTWGPRYTLDFTVPLLLLTALGIRRWPRSMLLLLTAISIIQYLVGVLYFGVYTS